MSSRPDYKSHPLWNDAMALTREAYALAERLAPGSPEASQRLRRSAVSVPARVAGALSEGGERRAELVLAARGALAEIASQARAADVGGGEALARQAGSLERAILFELGAAEAVS